MVSEHRLTQRCSSLEGLESSNPNMSRMPMNPSVEQCLTALLRRAMDLLDFLEPAVPTVDATWLATSKCCDSLESELMVPERGPTGLLRLLARLTIVATVRQ